MKIVPVPPVQFGAGAWREQGRRARPFRGCSWCLFCLFPGSGVALGSSVGNIPFGVLVFLWGFQPAVPYHLHVSWCLSDGTGGTWGQGTSAQCRPVRLLTRLPQRWVQHSRFPRLWARLFSFRGNQANQLINLKGAGVPQRAWEAQVQCQSWGLSFLLTCQFVFASYVLQASTSWKSLCNPRPRSPAS